MNFRLEIGSKPTWLDQLADWANVGVGFLALVVAFFSIIVSLKALKHQERHNKLSVKPIPFVGVGNFADRLFVKIVNNGTGPLIIRSVLVTNGVSKASDIISLMPTLPAGMYWANYIQSLEGRSIPPQQEIILIDFKCDPQSPIHVSFRDHCRDVLASLCVTVEHSDIYDQNFSPISRRLTWFARPEQEEL